MSQWLHGFLISILYTSRVIIFKTLDVRRFHQFASDEDFISNAAALAEDLLAAGVDGLNLATYYTAGYDSPFVIFNRTNEVWIMKN